MNPEQQTPPQYQPSPDEEPQSQPQAPVEPEQQAPVEPQAPASFQPAAPVQEAPAPAPEATPFVAAAPAPAAPATDPGKGLGIAGFILAFIIPIVGLPLSIVGYRKSRKGGFKNSLALAGIILNAIFLVLGILVFLLISMVAYNGISQKAKASQLQPTDTGSSLQTQSDTSSSIQSQ